MKKLTFITILTLVFDICLAQTFNVEKERWPGVSTLIIKSFNGCCAQKGYKARYFFNEQGQAIKSKHLFKRRTLSRYEYQYDKYGNLTHEIETYSINDKNRIDTNLILYQLDKQERVTIKTHVFGPDLNISYHYSDFDTLDRPRRIERVSSWLQDTSVQILTYNSTGQVKKIQSLKNDSLTTTEILDYNKQGDLCYSLIPGIVGKENEPLVIWSGGNRHAPEEQYDYVYGSQNRWTEKYIICKDKKVLFETTKYK